MKRIVLLSDTHGHFDEKLPKYLEGCDEIWHAGDIGDLAVTDKLKEFSMLRAVYGNIDNHLARREFQEKIRFPLEGFDVLMTHIGGKPYVYSKNIVNELNFNPPQIFICGHSHILRVEYDKKRNFLYLNPGACGVHGFHKVKTLLRFTLDKGNIKDMEVVELGVRA
jgi:uncharacterized protein